MPNGLIASDWNGTLFGENTTEGLNKKIGYALLADAKEAVRAGDVLAAGTLAKLFAAKFLTEAALAGYKAGVVHLRNVYRPFNIAIRGQSLYRILGIVDDYAAETAHKIDRRIAEPVRDMHQEGKDTGILSVAYQYSIIRTLEKAGFGDAFDMHDIVASNLRRLWDGRVIGFTSDIYGRKPETLEEEFFRKRGFRPERTLYIGDSEDDEGIAPMLPAGNFIVPFFATDAFRQRMASRNGAFVPESKEDLSQYLHARA